MMIKMGKVLIVSLLCVIGCAGDLSADWVRALPAFVERPIEGAPYDDGATSRVWMKVCDNTPFGPVCGEHRFDIKRRNMPSGAAKEGSLEPSSLFMYGFFQLAAASVSFEEDVSGKAYAQQAFATAVIALHVLSNIVNLETIHYVWDALWEAKHVCDTMPEADVCQPGLVQTNLVYAETLFHKIQGLMNSFSYDEMYEVARAAVVEAVRALTSDKRKVTEIESLMNQESTWMSTWRQMCGPENLSLRPGTNGTIYPNDYVCRPNSPSYEAGFFSVAGGFEFCSDCKGWLDEVEPLEVLEHFHEAVNYALKNGMSVGQRFEWGKYFSTSTFRRLLQGFFGNYKVFNGVGKAWTAGDFEELVKGANFYGKVPLEVLNRILALFSAWDKKANASVASETDVLICAYEKARMEYEQAVVTVDFLSQILSKQSDVQEDCLLFEELEQAKDVLNTKRLELEGLEAGYLLAQERQKELEAKNTYANIALFEASVRMAATFVKQTGNFVWGNAPKAGPARMDKKIADVFNWASPVVLTPTSIYRASEHAVQIQEDWDLKVMAQKMMTDPQFAKDRELMAVLEGVVDKSQMADYVALFMDVLGVLRNTLALLANTINVNQWANSQAGSQVIATQRLIGSYLGFALWSFTGNLSFSKLVYSIVKDWQLGAQSEEVIRLQQAIEGAKRDENYERAVALSLSLLKVDTSAMARLLLARIRDSDYKIRNKTANFLVGLGLSEDKVRAISSSNNLDHAQKLIERHLEVG